MTKCLSWVIGFNLTQIYDYSPLLYPLVFRWGNSQDWNPSVSNFLNAMQSCLILLYYTSILVFFQLPWTLLILSLQAAFFFTCYLVYAFSKISALNALFKMISFTSRSSAFTFIDSKFTSPALRACLCFRFLFLFIYWIRSPWCLHTSSSWLYQNLNSLSCLQNYPFLWLGNHYSLNYLNLKTKKRLLLVLSWD